jgi:signal transduction histidine kinase/DNA-binding response OmpR family regulator/ligand-binding sensor domain-containing protein
MGWDSAGLPVYTRYTNKEKLPSHINHYGIQDMYKDDQGFLWLATVGLGLQRLNIATGEIKSYKHDPDDPYSISHNMISSICEDDSGNLWIGTGFIQFKTGGGLNKFDRKTEQFTNYRHNLNNPFSLSSDIIKDVFIDRNNNLWVGVSDEGLFSVPLHEINGDSKPQFNRYAGAGSWMNSVYEDRQGNIWVASQSFFIKKYNPQQNIFPFFKHISNNPNSLAGYYVLCIYIDSKNNIWFGHQNTGLTKYNPRTKTYKHYNHHPENPNGLSENWINAICEDNDGNIWIGTQSNGINILNPANDTFRQITADNQNPKELSSNNVKMIIKSTSGDLYIISNQSGMQLYNVDNEQFVKLDLDTTSTEDEDILAMYEEQFGKLWVGTRTNGMYSVSIKDYQIESVEHYIHNPYDQQSLSNNLIGDIIQPQVGDTNALWISTNGGLNRFDLQTRTFTHLMEKEGLSSNFVMEVLEDNSGNIWCTTLDGISKYNPRTGKIKNYTKEDGLPVTYFGGGRAVSAVGADGQLYFCSSGFGVIAFSPEKIKDNPYIPPIRLTDFKVFHKSITLDTSIQFKKELTLTHDQNAFSFEFAALNFTNPLKNQYAYKMEGLIDDWILIGTERKASFTNLVPGNYVFRVKGSNNDGIWNEKGTSIQVTILPPWWRTWWAYSIYVIIFVLMLYALRRYDLKRQRLKSELALEYEHSQKLQDIDRMKSRFFANISHEFRTPLTLILGPIEKLLSKVVDTETQNELSIMQRNAKCLQRLINQLLDLSKLEAGGMTIQANEINIVELVYGYVQSFESLAERKGIELNFRAEEENISAFVDRDKIEKILNNLLSNALKFTNEGGLVEVAVGSSNGTTKTYSVYSDLIIIKVSDTGIGIPPSRIEKIFDRFYQIDDSQKREHEGTGIGLALTKELVELHHGQIMVKSEVGKGTIFSISLPLGRDHFQVIETVDDQLDTSLSTVKEKEHTHIEETATDYADNSEQPLLGKTGKPIVLIVEDNPDMRAYISSHLDEYYKILEAEDGQQGFDKAIEAIPDLIISDVMMPKMDGFELCDKIKTDSCTSHIPVILLTARAESEDRIEGLQTGADDYLIKPFDAKELQVRVKNLIEQRVKLRKRFFKEIVLGSQEIRIDSPDEQFIKRLFNICQQHIAEADFNVDILGKEAGMSRSQLHRKLKGLTDQSATEFIKTLRLRRAALLIMESHENISKIAYEVGFNNLSYFNKSFKELFGQTPSDFLHNKKRG